MHIHPDTKIGAVHLVVSDFGRSLPYYQQNIGLTLHSVKGDTAYLGVGGPDLLVLRERPSARRPQQTTGLYHFALLVPSRRALAQTLKHLIDTETRLDGASDHLVSEALYLSDLDGNGIELYRDRPRLEWPMADGKIKMATLPFNVQGILNELNGQNQAWEGLPPGTTIGHIHLHVTNLAEAEAFYTQTLGFDLITRYGSSAAFVSAGGYHHHIGLNTWAGVGAPPPPQGAIGLNFYEILLPAATLLPDMAARLQQAAVPCEHRESGLFLHDPSQNGILLRVTS